MRLFRLVTITALIILTLNLANDAPGARADGGENKKRGTDQSQEQAQPLPEKAELNYPNLGSHLDQLVAEVEEGEATAKDAAGEAPMHQGESVAVTIYLSGNVDDVVKFLEDNGGDPRNVGEDYIEAYVPVSLLGPVSERAGVLRVREIVPPENDFGDFTSQGVQVHLSDAWNQAGYKGQGVKVGVIDSDAGFTGYGSLIGTELPAPAGVRCYTDLGVFTQNLADCEDEGTHGTRVAESLVDIAPEVSLYIAAPSSRGDLQSTVDWMVSQDVSVVVMSEGYPFDGPGDGTSHSSNSPLRAVDRAVKSGIIWVASAGNQARRTWFAHAPFLDGDGDGFIEFAGIDEVNDINLEAGDRLRVQLRWDDSWGGANTNFDLGLQYGSQLIAGSVDPQSGAAGHFPIEKIAGNVLSSGEYGIVVEHVSGSVPDWIQLTVWDAPFIQHYTKNGSITNPAESANPGLLAVGAAHWDDVRAIEPYSSRGPTPDGRVEPKPDIVGAACGETALRPLNEYNSGFCGTSQAAPHVAGLAALVRQRFPELGPVEVAEYLKGHAIQREAPDPNNTWGHGFAVLPPIDGTPPAVPTPSNSFTRNPAADFNTLIDASNSVPLGIWSDDTTMWVVDWFDEKIYAYDMTTKARVPGKDFDTLEAAGNEYPEGIWSDGTTMWVVDWFDEKIYAYDMGTKARVPGKDFDTLEAAGNEYPAGIWSDGTTVWVADWFDEKIYAYDMTTKARVPGKDFDTLQASRNLDPAGIWSDGTTMWIADYGRDKIYAYDMATKARVPGREFNTLEAAGNENPEGIWSDGTTMWVADWFDEKIYAYNMPPAPPSMPPGAASINSVSAGASSLTVSWSEPPGDASGITAYDLRHIPTGDDETVAANWTVVQDVWNTGSGPLQYALTGLTGGTQYDLQVRAVNSAGDGPWSATVTGTPQSTSASATRSFSPAAVAPGGIVRVTIALANTGGIGQVTETIPNGFTYSSSSLPAGNVDTSDMATPVFNLLEAGPSFTYDVTAPMTEGEYTFSGKLRAGTPPADYDVGGATRVTVTAGDPLVVRYDTNRNGRIDRIEVIRAINDYLSSGGTSISRSDVIRLINLYLSG